jgi:hypothetical protein
MVPLFDYKVPIKADPKVNKEKGTGVVKCATFVIRPIVNGSCNKPPLTVR